MSETDEPMEIMGLTDMNEMFACTALKTMTLGHHMQQNKIILNGTHNIINRYIIISYNTYTIISYITYNITSYITHIISYITHIILSYITHIIFSYITHITSYITHIIFSYISYVHHGIYLPAPTQHLPHPHQ